MLSTIDYILFGMLLVKKYLENIPALSSELTPPLKPRHWFFKGGVFKLKIAQKAAVGNHQQKLLPRLTANELVRSTGIRQTTP